MIYLEKKRYGHRCPYCDKKVNFMYVAFHLRDGEYTCNKCHRYSNVKYNPLIYLFIVFTTVLACVLGLMYENTITGIVMSAVPFILLRLSLPFFYRLMPIKIKAKSTSTQTSETYVKNKKKKEEKIKEYIPKSKNNNTVLDFNEENDGQTRYIPNIKG